MNSKIRLISLLALSAVAIGAVAAGLSHCYGSSDGGKNTSVAADTVEVAAVEDVVAGETVMTAEKWADSIMLTLSPRQRVAQLIIPRWDIGVTSREEMRRQVVTEGIGGFLLGKGSIDAYADIINREQAEAKVPLLITLDGEWGLSMRITGTPRFPYNIALGAIQDPKLLEEYGKEVARECRLAGIHVDFAPVLDVNSNPSNPVIGYRSFGEDPGHVAKLGAAYCRGMESGGVMSVGKHFPGHGDTSVDSHKALPTVDHSRSELEKVDFLPFVEAKNAGMSGIMVGHLRVPALDKSGLPASMSKVITTDVLQKELGFKGLIFTDALGMKGASVAGENSAVGAFRAGADVLLGSHQPVKDLQAMMDAIKNGRISQDEVDRRCRKLLTYKFKLGLVTPQVIKKEGLAAKINSPEAKALLDRLSKASITVVRDNNSQLPVDMSHQKDVTLISLGASSREPFAEVCGKYSEVQNIRVTTAAEEAKAVSAARKAGVVIVAVFKNDAVTRNAFARLRSACPEMIPVFFINPFKMSGFGDLSSLPVFVTANDNTPELQAAAAGAIFGAFDVTGRFPVNIKGVASLGEGVDLKKKD